MYAESGLSTFRDATHFIGEPKHERTFTCKELNVFFRGICHDYFILISSDFQARFFVN